MTLPPFPLDDDSLLMLRRGCGIDAGAEISSLLDTLEILSIQGGHDPDAYSEEEDGIVVMRDASYSVNDAIVALVDEVLRVREER